MRGSRLLGVREQVIIYGEWGYKTLGLSVCVWGGGGGAGVQVNCYPTVAQMYN